MIFAFFDATQSRAAACDAKGRSSGVSASRSSQYPSGLDPCCMHASLTFSAHALTSTANARCFSAVVRALARWPIRWHGTVWEGKRGGGRGRGPVHLNAIWMRQQHASQSTHITSLIMPTRCTLSLARRLLPWAQVCLFARNCSRLRPLLNISAAYRKSGQSAAQKKDSHGKS